MPNLEQRLKYVTMADIYLESDRACPHCGGVIQFQESEVVDQSTEHMIYACENCNAEFAEVFKRVGLHFPEHGVSVPLPDWQDTARI